MAKMTAEERSMLIRGGFGFLSALFGVIFKKKKGRKDKVINIMSTVFELTDDYDDMANLVRRIKKAGNDGRGVNMNDGEVAQLNKLFRLIDALGV